MENASKALVIAGGVLLAMMILALLVYASGAMDTLADSQDMKLAAQQLSEFNKGYESYNRTRLYGSDVISVYNKAEDEEDCNIEIIALDEDGNHISIENTHEFKISVFKCLGETIGYDEQTGRINRMVFEKIKIDT